MMILQHFMLFPGLQKLAEGRLAFVQFLTRVRLSAVGWQGSWGARTRW
jgi:hypothetical protein